ncbi:DUF2283 domain-containing protein [Sulfuricystis multivorans]|uniref:DUF2283 domain-containing protein n=1 Tax=Sulfuricystis multivorans TaxID=2211108 RepID=UPI000F829CCC|nr:DUF2283 domain-containing protein [Sulfuricystis multivorans]
MKFEFDPVADAAYMEISDAEIERSESVRPGVVIDYDKEGNVVGIELLSVSKRAKAPLPKAA